VIAALLTTGVLMLESPYDRIGVAPAGTLEIQGFDLGTAQGAIVDGRLVIPAVTIRAVRVIELVRTPRTHLEWRVNPQTGADDTTAAQAAVALAVDAGEPAQVPVLTVNADRGRLRTGDLLATGAPEQPELSELPSNWIGREILVLRGERSFELTISPVEVGAQLASLETPIEPSVQVIGVRGTSSGLAVALAVYDANTAGDLTGGRTIAATGTVTAGGTVGPVRGIAAKAWSAAAAGAGILLVPVGQGDQARRSGAPVTIIEVGTLAEAVTALSR
jgi:hypothetical protein